MLDFKGQSADWNESKSGQIFCQRHEVKSINFGENPRRSEIWGLPRCKNLTRFSLFVSFCFAVRYCLKCFCFLCFTSSVSFTGSYTELKPKFEVLEYIYIFIE